MILLPNGCHSSDLSVHPKNWKTKKASLRVSWYIFYRFYDPQFDDHPKYKGVKLVKLRGIDKFSDLEQRQAVVQAMLDNEMELLTRYAYNPITGIKTIPEDVVHEIDPYTGFVDALKAAKKKLNVAPATISEIDVVIRGIEKPASQIRIHNIPIKDISRRHIRLLLDQCKKTHDRWSAHKFNRYRSCLMILFSELMELEATEQDPITKIRKQKMVKKVRDVVTDEQREQINAHLKPNYYTFWRFLHIFFHSGARIVEMMHVEAKDVNLKAQKFKVTVIKGTEYRQVTKTIKDNVLYLWEEIMREARPADFLFSRGLVPGPKAIRREQITNRWKRHVKIPLGVTADIYSLKHSNTTAVVKAMSKREQALQTAAEINSHTTTAMVKNIYDVNAEAEKHDIIRKVNNEF